MSSVLRINLVIKVWLEFQAAKDSNLIHCNRYRDILPSLRLDPQTSPVIEPMLTFSGAQANRVDFWVGLTNTNAVISSCSGNACAGQGWFWEKSKIALAPAHLTFYNDELFNATLHQTSCIKNYYYPPGVNTYHSLFSVPCTDQLTVIVCQIC